jgi:hypothetical protein
MEEGRDNDLRRRRRANHAVATVAVKTCDS